MEPMKSLQGIEAWWPKDLGSPSSSGSQDGMRYAFFPDRRRLLVETDGRIRTYDTGDRRIGAVAQAGCGSPTFTDADGTVALPELRAID